MMMIMITIIIIIMMIITTTTTTTISQWMEHISACPILAKEQYIKRYDSVCAELYYKIC
jgi:accessory gene regulator protein AgrB